MSGFGTFLRKLTAQQKRLGKLIAKATKPLKPAKPRKPARAKQSRVKAPIEPVARRARLNSTFDFGSNPGNLRMLSFVPKGLPPAAPLVVVLHGCTLSAADYDLGTGWSSLATCFGFAVLYPEQKLSNNAQLCFNWFLPADTARGSGEVASIRQMIGKIVADHRLDPKRVFITGLSAGGAMTAAMLACYPEIFSHGAIIAGLPYRSATSGQSALGAMFHGVTRSGEEWAAFVREASAHLGPYPKVSIWHGTADRTVRPSNALELAKQWTAVHCLSPVPSREELVRGFPHRIWKNASGAVAVETYEITGMGHGTPIACAKGSKASRFGKPGKYSLDVGMSSSFLLARRWGLVG